ncbi:hypothetical protein J4E91_001528 [Alternaria rosae]|nr:hypothetical protein J4E91_001528 [Alternaria rosae]
MVGFLDLPSELIFIIIDLVLSSPAILPKNGTRHRPSYPTQSRNLYCVPSLNYLKDPGVLSLLLTSHRMYCETKEFLSKAPRNFEVDIAVIDDHWFWPTRRVVPLRKLEGTIERLDINIIPCCTAEERHLQTNWDQGPGLETWIGPPLDEHFDNGRNPPVNRIDTMTINFDSGRYGNGNGAIGLTDIPFRKTKGLAHLNFEQLYPVDFAKSATYLREVSRYIDEWTLVNYGTGRSTRKIRKIQLYLDGKMSRELNTEV